MSVLLPADVPPDVEPLRIDPEVAPVPPGVVLPMFSAVPWFALPGPTLLLSRLVLVLPVDPALLLMLEELESGGVLELVAACAANEAAANAAAIAIARVFEVMTFLDSVVENKYTRTSHARTIRCKRCTAPASQAGDTGLLYNGVPLIPRRRLVPSFEMFAVLALVGAAWLWIDSLAARAAAVQAARESCAADGLLLLDDTVSIASLKLARGRDGHIHLQRAYDFEYSDSGDNRLPGSVVILGREVILLNVGMRGVDGGTHLPVRRDGG
jgi:hypothetical protein